MSHWRGGVVTIGEGVLLGVGVITIGAGVLMEG